MLFTPVLLTALNASVQSATIVAPVSGVVTVTSGNATILVGGVDRGTTFSVTGGQPLAIQITESSGSYATATHALFTMAGKQYSFTCVTGYSSSSATAPLPIYVTGANTLQLGATHTTNLMQVQGTPDVLPLSVPAVHGAFITKNGTPVGQSTTASNGDTFSVTLTAPTTTATAIEVPVFIGNRFSAFIATTPPISTAPTPPYFVDVVDAALATVVQSPIYTVSGLDAARSATIDWISGSGTIIKNGTAVTLPNNVVNGDTLRFSVTTSAAYATTVYRAVSIGTAQASWCVTTLANPDAFIDAAFRHKALFDVPLTGSTPVTLNQDNALIKVDTTSYGTSSYSLYNPAVVTDNSASPFLISPSFYEGKVYKVGLSGNIAGLTTLAAGTTVYDVAYSPKYNAVAAVPTRRFATISGTVNVVRELDSANADIPIAGGALYGIDSSKDGTYLYVATAASTVVVLTRNVSTGLYAVSSTINLAAHCASLGGLRDVVVDPVGNVWVAELSTGQVICITGSNNLYSSKTLLNSDPWAMACDTSSLWIACSYTNTIIQVDIATRGVIRTVNVRSAPSAIAVNPATNDVWVGHYGCNLLTVYDAGTGYALLRTVTLPQPVTAITMDGNGGAWVQCLYKNLPSFQAPRLHQPTQMDAIAFTPVVDAPFNTTITSNEVAVSGLARPAVLSVPPINNYRIVKNTVGYTSLTVSNGDVISLRADVPAESAIGRYVTTSFEATEANVKSTWSYRTLPDSIPDTLYFDALTNVAITGPVASTGVALTGMSPGAVVSLELEDPAWVINVNGVPSPTGFTATATLGDLISITGAVSGMNYGAAVSCDIQYVVGVTKTVMGTFIVQSMVNPAPEVGGSNRGRNYVNTYWIGSTTYGPTRVYARPNAVVVQSQTQKLAGTRTATKNTTVSVVLVTAQRDYLMGAAVTRTFVPTITAVKSQSKSTLATQEPGYAIGAVRSSYHADGNSPTLSNHNAYSTDAFTPVSVQRATGFAVTTDPALVVTVFSNPRVVDATQVYSASVTTAQRVVDAVSQYALDTTTQYKLVDQQVGTYSKLEQRDPLVVGAAYVRNVSSEQYPAIAEYVRSETRANALSGVSTFVKGTNTDRHSETKEYVRVATNLGMRVAVVNGFAIGASRNLVPCIVKVFVPLPKTNIRAVASPASFVTGLTHNSNKTVGGMSSTKSVRSPHTVGLGTIERTWIVHEEDPGSIMSQGLFTSPALAVADGVYRGFPTAVSYTMQTIVNDAVAGGEETMPITSYMWVVPPTDVPTRPPAANQYPIPSRWYVSGG